MSQTNNVIATSNLRPTSTDMLVGFLGNTEKMVSLTITNTGNAQLIITKIFSERTNAVYYDGIEKGEIEIAAGESREIEIAIKPQKIGRLLDVILLKCNARNAGTKGVYKILATAEVI